MQSKIIFIEGNPGSGKTTFAKRLEHALMTTGYQVNMYQEGDLHPIDLAWCAILTKEQFKATMDQYPVLKEDILRLSKPMDNHYVVAYTKVNHLLASKEFYDDMSSYEIYRSDSLEVFKNTHQTLWNQFPKHMEQDTIYIFECVFIQNHINELILKYHLPKQEIIHYFQELIHPLISLNPMIFFIKQMDVKSSIDHVADERRTHDPTKFRDWIDLVIEYIEALPYAKSLGYTGYDGIIKYFQDRQTMTLHILKNLSTDTTVLQLDKNHDHLFEQLLNKVLETM